MTTAAGIAGHIFTEHLAVSHRGRMKPASILQRSAVDFGDSLAAEIGATKPADEV